MSVPDTDWKATEPGMIALPTTKYRIVWTGEKYLPFRIYWGDHELAPTSDLDSAKERVQWHIKQMIQMGFEP